MDNRRGFLSRLSLTAASAAFASVTTSLSARADGGLKLASMVVAYPPGGSSDAVARMLAAQLQGRYADAVIVENRAGASGRIAVEYVKRQKPDGVGMFVGPDSLMTLFPYVYKNLAYEWQKDFSPVGRICNFSMALYAGPGLPANVRTIADLGKWAKADPRAASYGTAPPGSTPHMAGVLFTRCAGGGLTPVHYVGNAPGIADLLGGHIPIFIGAVGDGLQYVESGKLRVLAITGAVRSPYLPQVPTLTELGYRDAVLEDAFSVFLPAKVSTSTVRSLSGFVRDGVSNTAFATGLGKWGMVPSLLGPDELSANMKLDEQRWAALIKESGFTPESS